MKTVNPRIPEILQAYNIPYNDGIAYLLSVQHEVVPSYIPPILVQRMNMTNILGYNSSGITWNEPLFLEEKEESNDKWKWVVDEYMAMFESVNPKRKGTKSSCISRMQSFFAKNPDVRKEDILAAVKLYIGSVQNPEYLITSHYFIYKDKGKDRTSSLEEWVDKYMETVKTTPVQEDTHISNRLQ